MPRRPRMARPALPRLPRVRAGDRVRVDEPARLAQVFRDDLSSFELRPVVRKMSREATSWFVAHPGARSPDDVNALRVGLLRQPDLQALMIERMDALLGLLRRSDAATSELPPLMLQLDYEPLIAGRYDELVRALPDDSTVLIDAPTADSHPRLGEEAAERARSLGLAVGLSGIPAQHADEEKVVRRLRPGVLFYDQATPMDYRDRMTQMLRLRAEANDDARIVVASVTSIVDEWAGLSCGATHLCGPLYDAVDLGEALARSNDAWTAYRPDPEDAYSPFELAARRFPSRTATLETVLDCAAEVRARVCEAGGAADAYIALDDLGKIPQRVQDAVAAMARAGAGVTVVARGMTCALLDDITCGTLDDDDPLGQGWTFAALTPGTGHLITAHSVGDVGDQLRRRYAYVEAEDRELARRVASRISTRAAESPVVPRRG